MSKKKHSYTPESRWVPPSVLKKWSQEDRELYTANQTKLHSDRPTANRKHADSRTLGAKVVGDRHKRDSETGRRSDKAELHAKRRAEYAEAYKRIVEQADACELALIIYRKQQGKPLTKGELQQLRKSYLWRPNYSTYDEALYALQRDNYHRFKYKGHRFDLCERPPYEPPKSLYKMQQPVPDLHANTLWRVHMRWEFIEMPLYRRKPYKSSRRVWTPYEMENRVRHDYCWETMIDFHYSDFTCPPPDGWRSMEDILRGAERWEEERKERGRKHRAAARAEWEKLPPDSSLTFHEWYDKLEEEREEELFWEEQAERRESLSKSRRS